MRVAVIGGGASGLTTAWLLDAVHDVQVFERDSVPGGNVRTLGGNVACAGLEDGVISENGVSWFHTSTYPNTHRLLSELKVKQSSKLLDSSIILSDGRRCHVSVLDCLRHIDWEELWLERADLAGAAREILGLFRRTELVSAEPLKGTPLDAYLNEVEHLTAQWARGIVGAFFSAPYSDVGRFPADMLFPSLRRWLMDRRCTVIPGGIFSYLQQMIESMRGQIRCGVRVLSIRRELDGVSVQFPDGPQQFDRVVIATTPQAAFQLLSDPTSDEIRWFGAWKDRRYRTTAHFSETMYKDRSIDFRTQCDCFEESEHETVAYNCCLNSLYDIDSQRQYSFSSCMEDQIEPDRILHQQDHVTPIYHVDASVYRQQIREANGLSNTYYVGAYLIDGLQEGAITSALDVARLLGGRSI